MERGRGSLTGIRRREGGPIAIARYRKLDLVGGRGTAPRSARQACRGI